jgi:DNA-binding response OmpR family regulator
MQVLVVEDNVLLAFLIEDALVEMGHTVVGPIGSADAALRLAEELQGLDLALVDIDLADGSSGVDLARDLRVRWGVPTIFATGQIANARANTDVALGVLSKPFSPTAVVQAVDAAAKIRNGDTVSVIPAELELFG